MNKAAGVALHMSRAAENLQAARKLLGEGHFGISASRAYYAMFYAAEAALLHRDLQFSRHSAVMSFFNKEFVKPGVFRPKAFKALQGAYDKRIQEDYTFRPLTEEDAKGVLAEAKEFVSEMTTYLRKKGYEIA